MTIYFDMDGTIADFYGVENWLNYLEAHDTPPHEVATPLTPSSPLPPMLNRLKREGYTLGIISWCSRSGTPEYNDRTAEAKRNWLAKHLPSVQFDIIHIIPYGTPKNRYNKGNDILFDDEERNRKAWTGRAYRQDEIFEVLKEL